MTTVAAPHLAPAAGPDRAGLMALLGGTFIIGWSAVVVRFADVGPISSAAWRMIFALPVLWAWSRLLAGGRAGAPTAPALPAKVKLAALFAGLFFAADVGVFHLSLSATDIANASFISNVAPILVIIGGALFYRERPPARVWAALALALFGSWMMAGLVTPAALGRGDILALGAAFFYSAYLLFIKQVRSRLDGPAATFWTGAVSAAVLIVWALASGETVLPGSLQGWAAVAFLGVCGHALGQGLTSIAMGRVSVGLVALVILTWAPMSAFWAWVVFDERLTAFQLGGAAIILAALALTHPRFARR
jgi:drug/metabolite transporter (DMT)-like permease